MNTGVLEIKHEECFNVMWEDVFVNLMHSKNKNFQIWLKERLEMDYVVKIKTLIHLSFNTCPSHTYMLTWNKLCDSVYDVSWECPLFINRAMG